MYPKEYLDYLIYFHAQRDYFECHEILEEYWKKEENPSLRKKVWVGLIQIAVSLYHQRRKNFSGSLKMMEGALNIFENETDDLERLGLHSASLVEQIKQRIEDIKNRKAYESMTLPLREDVLEECQQLCQQQQLTWGIPSDVNNEALIHKHTLRDRSDVLEERDRQRKRRRNT